MQFAICNEIFQDWTLEATFAYAKKVGYHGVEIAPFTLCKRVTDVRKDERTIVRNLAREAEIQIAGIHWVLAKTEGFHLTHPDQATRARTSEYLVELVQFCADIGGKRMIVGSPKQRDLVDGVSQEQGLEWAAGVFQASAKRAEDTGVTICFEPLAPTETNFVNRASEAIKFATGLASPSFKIILDVKAMSAEGKSIPQVIRESWPHFAHFHANDPNLKGPGFGATDFRPIAAALKEVGYQGYVSVEVFNFEEGAEVIASQSIQYLREVFS